jgi:hypothetical protein
LIFGLGLIDGFNVTFALLVKVEDILIQERFVAKSAIQS